MRFPKFPEPIMSRLFGVACVLAAVMIAFCCSTSSASAQATRTWVSGVGDDANPCSRPAPCQTFAGAITKTAQDGEINCLDPGDFGAVTIAKSITIDCHEITGPTSQTPGSTSNPTGTIASAATQQAFSLIQKSPGSPGLFSCNVRDTHIVNVLA
jgi:hypothetical protein